MAKTESGTIFETINFKQLHAEKSQKQSTPLQ